MRFGYEKGHTQIQAQPAGLFTEALAPDLQYLLDSVGYAPDILLGFSWQTNHKIELEPVPTGAQCSAHGSKQISIGYVFVDPVAQALRACFGGEGEAGSLHPLYTLGQVHPEGVGAYRRQAD